MVRDLFSALVTVLIFKILITIEDKKMKFFQSILKFTLACSWVLLAADFSRSQTGGQSDVSGPNPIETPPISQPPADNNPPPTNPPADNGSPQASSPSNNTQPDSSGGQNTNSQASNGNDGNNNNVNNNLTQTPSSSPGGNSGSGTGTNTTGGSGTTTPGTNTANSGSGTTTSGTNTANSGSGTTTSGTNTAGGSGTTTPGTNTANSGTVPGTNTTSGSGTNAPGTNTANSGSGTNTPGTNTAGGSGTNTPGTNIAGGSGTNAPGTNTANSGSGTTTLGTNTAGGSRTTTPGTNTANSGTVPGTNTTGGSGTNAPGTNTANSGSGTNTPGTNTAGGSGTTTPGTNTANSGSGTTTPGTNTANSGSGTTTPGTNTANSGSGTTTPGTNTANSGSGTTTPGTNTANSGTTTPSTNTANSGSSNTSNTGTNTANAGNTNPNVRNTPSNNSGQNTNSGTSNNNVAGKPPTSNTTTNNNNSGGNGNSNGQGSTTTAAKPASPNSQNTKEQSPDSQAKNPQDPKEKTENNQQEEKKDSQAQEDEKKDDNQEQKASGNGQNNASIDRVAYEAQIQQAGSDLAVQILEEFQATELMGSANLELYGKAPSVQEISKRLGELWKQTGKKPVFINVSVQSNRLETFAVLPTLPDTAKNGDRLVASTNPVEPVQTKAVRQTIGNISRQQVLDTAKQFSQEISDPARIKDSNYMQSSRQLYTWIVAPIEAQLKAANADILVFSMDSGLRLLPIAALNDGKQFLIEKYAVALVPSFGLTDTRYVDISKSSILAMGASQFQDQIPLPTIPIELQNITRNPRSGDVFLNEQFTIENFVAQNSSQKRYDIIHLGTHAEFLPGDSQDSYIQFYNGKLKMPELRKLSNEFGWNSAKTAPVELLVLSACQTALGNEKAELGFAGLAVQAGVKSALASLWQVSDLGTLGLMSEFYQDLSEAPIKAEALRNAQLAMLKGKVRIENGKLFLSDGQTENLPQGIPQGNVLMSHPYFWSPFTLIGNWN
jgi:CHAT domain-containing protein